MARDKKIFLLDKEYYSEEEVNKLTEDALEEMASKEEYNYNPNIIKLDANGYSTPQQALNADYYDCDNDDYYVISFGF
jgi:hypothetical protein